MSGHRGVEGNEAADALANLGAKMGEVAEREWAGLVGALEGELEEMARAGGAGAARGPNVAAEEIEFSVRDASSL